MYVALQNLYATEICGTVGSTVYSDTTVGLDPGELSTRIICYTTGPVTYWDWTSRAEFMSNVL